MLNFKIDFHYFANGRPSPILAFPFWPVENTIFFKRDFIGLVPFGLHLEIQPTLYGLETFCGQIRPGKAKKATRMIPNISDRGVREL